MIYFRVVGAGTKLSKVFTFIPSLKQDLQSSLQEVEDLQQSYIDTFTTHGVTRLVLGRPLEKLYWGVILIAAIAFLCYLFHFNLARYIKKDIRTEVHTEFRNTVQLPRITICFSDSIISQIYCYKNRSINGLTDLCAMKSYSKKRNVLYWQREYWKKASRLFNCCWDINRDGNVSLSKRGSFYIRVEDGEGSKNYTDPSMRNTILVSTQDPKEVHATKRESWPLLASDLFENEFYPGSYQVSIDVTETQRLKAPYPSKCLDENNKLNLFSTKYTTVTCLETCAIQKLLNRCGDVIPIWEKFVPSNMKRNVTFMSDKERWECFLRFAKDFHYNDCGCPYQCKETSYFLRSTYRHNDRPFSSNIAASWELDFKTVNNKVATIKEYEAYSYIQFLSDFGGHLGLFIGSSLISLFEFLAYLMMFCHISYLKMR